MSASSALQAAIVMAMRGNAALSAAVGARISDVPEINTQYPCISLGNTSFFPERQDCFRRIVETVQIDVWTRAETQRHPCKDICGLVVDVLDQADLTLADPYSLARCELRLARVMDDPDGITHHGVLQFECEVVYA